jgi:hypothetical protein
MGLILVIIWIPFFVPMDHEDFPFAHFKQVRGIKGLMRIDLVFIPFLETVLSIALTIVVLKHFFK